MPRLRLPTRPRLKFALLGAAGGALILLPLGQVLRYQAAELDELRAERALLDPIAQALAVQQALLSHRDVADRVLRGRQTLEPERRLRQGEVDAQVRQLQATLQAGGWLRALQEGRALAQDWHALARRIMQGLCNAADSVSGHQLLVEQAVQVMDLVNSSASAAVLPQGVAGHSRTAAELGAWAGLLHQQDTRLLERQARLQAQLALNATALAALLALGLTLRIAAGKRRVRRGTDDVRQGHGRRASDSLRERDAAAQLMLRLRQGEIRSSFEPR